MVKRKNKNDHKKNKKKRKTDSSSCGELVVVPCKTCRETTFRTKVSNLSNDVESRRQRRTEHDHGVQAHDGFWDQA